MTVGEAAPNEADLLSRHRLCAAMALAYHRAGMGNAIRDVLSRHKVMSICGKARNTNGKTLVNNMRLSDTIPVAVVVDGDLCRSRERQVVRRDPHVALKLSDRGGPCTDRGAAVQGRTASLPRN